MFSTLASNAFSRPSAAGAPAEAPLLLSALACASELLEPQLLNISPTALPSELWGEIASFSLRKDVLQLRATSHELKAQADFTITTLAINGGADLVAFGNATGFEYLKALQLSNISSVDLQQFAQELTAHPRPGLMVNIQSNCGFLTQGLADLSRIPLASLRLDTFFEVDPDVIKALAACPFPIELFGCFTREDLRVLPRVATLTKLLLRTKTFDDKIAALFLAHPALASISIQACAGFSSRGIEHLASIPTLQEISIEEAICRAAPIDSAAAAALAAHDGLKTLHFHTTIKPFSDASFLALSQSQSLRTITLAIGPGIAYLADIRSLTQLTLSGRCDERHLIDWESAESLAGMRNLASLTIAAAFFEIGCLPLLLAKCAAKALTLIDIELDTADVAALCSNTTLVELSLANCEMAAPDKMALFAHSSLLRLYIDYTLHLRG